MNTELAMLLAEPHMKRELANALGVPEDQLTEDYFKEQLWATEDPH